MMDRNRSVLPMKAAKIGYILLSALVCALGAVLITRPDVSLMALERTLGVCLVLYGAIKLAGYFSKDLFRLAFQYDLAFGILLLALGTVALARPEFTTSFLCVMMGIPLLADGLLKIQMSMDAKKFGISRWWHILALAILAVGFGIALVTRPCESAQTLMVLGGLSALSGGFLNLCVATDTIKIVRHQKPDDIEDEEGLFTKG